MVDCAFGMWALCCAWAGSTAGLAFVNAVTPCMANCAVLIAAAVDAAVLAAAVVAPAAAVVAAAVVPAAAPLLPNAARMVVGSHIGNPHKFVKGPLFSPVFLVSIEEREPHPLKPSNVDFVSGIYTVV